MAVGMSKSPFWEIVEKTPFTFEPESPVIIQGRQLVSRAQDMREEMFNFCIASEKFAVEFFAKPPKRVLDLGSGMGVNTVNMAKNGAHVTAIDSSKGLLEEFSRISVAAGCPAENIRLRCGDITKMDSYGEGFDLVVAVDILPYIAPK